MTFDTVKNKITIKTVTEIYMYVSREKYKVFLCFMLNTRAISACGGPLEETNICTRRICVESEILTVYVPLERFLLTGLDQ